MGLSKGGKANDVWNRFPPDLNGASGVWFSASSPINGLDAGAPELDDKMMFSSGPVFCLPIPLLTNEVLNQLLAFRGLDLLR